MSGTQIVILDTDMLGRMGIKSRGIKKRYITNARVSRPIGDFSLLPLITI
jgi:hypothetical protein